MTGSQSFVSVYEKKKKEKKKWSLDLVSVVCRSVFVPGNGGLQVSVCRSVLVPGKGSLQVSL